MQEDLQPTIFIHVGPKMDHVIYLHVTRVIKHGCDEKNMISSAGTCFLSVEVKEHVILMPSYIGQIKKGIFHKLNQRILEYSPDVQGVIVAYSKPVILQSTAAILEDDPQIHFDVKYHVCVF